jgi:hypothetical protein
MDTVERGAQIYPNPRGLTAFRIHMDCVILIRTHWAARRYLSEPSSHSDHASRVYL